MIEQSNTGTWSNAAEDRIALAGPDPSWARQFEAEATALAAALPRVGGLRIEHFGSTAVPGIRAKPIIDIMVIHPEPALWPALTDPVTALGYVFWRENPCTDRMFFVKGMPPYGSRRTHHLHVRVPADAVAELAFRDRLRSDSALARGYEQLKEELAGRYPTDREEYTQGKTKFVVAALGLKI